MAYRERTQQFLFKVYELEEQGEEMICNKNKKKEKVCSSSNEPGHLIKRKDHRRKIKVLTAEKTWLAESLQSTIEGFLKPVILLL